MEILLVLAIIALLLQLLASWGIPLLVCIDFRNWTYSTWIIVLVCNAAGLLTVLAVQLGPKLLQTIPDGWLGKVKDKWLTKEIKFPKHRRKPHQHSAFSSDDDYEKQRKLAEDWKKRAENRRPWR